jgi:hypothetical protein
LTGQSVPEHGGRELHKPPLTVAVLGEWGQGKSSLMRLIEGNLRKNRAYPVWFNAWHHQKEDHLLAYLLQAIRQQAVPPLLSLQGARFRLRLLGLRSARNRWVITAFLAVLAFCFGVAQHADTVTTLTDWVKQVTQTQAPETKKVENQTGSQPAATLPKPETKSDAQTTSSKAPPAVKGPQAKSGVKEKASLAAGELTSGTKSKSTASVAPEKPQPAPAAEVPAAPEKSAPIPAGSLTVFGISLLALLGLLKQIYDALIAFRVKPAALLKEAAGSASIKDLETRTSVRMDFGRQFGDVTRALDPYRMVIFIDDLDRCNPKSVVQILESVNFLQSAGDCFVVMGLAKPQVEASIGLSFKEVAEELGDDGIEKEPKARRRDYAQQYLKKLIQLEVKVPMATAEQQETLLTGRPTGETPKTKTYADKLATWGRANRPVAWVATALIIAGVCFWYGFTVKPAPTAPPPVTMVSAPIEPPPDMKDKGGGPETPKPKETGPVAFYPGERETGGLNWLPVLPGLLLVAFAIWILTRRPIEMINDSEDFTEALKMWRPVVGMQFDTPREMKRFVNRIRYIAMRWRRPSAQKAPVERFADWIQRKVGRNLTPAEKTSAEPQESADENEAAIVMMAALDGLGGENTLRTSAAVPEAKDALDWHRGKFGSVDVDWKRYREITGEVQAN